MVNVLLYNQNLIELVEILNIKQEQKDSLVSKIPQLDEEERWKLLEILTKILLLDLEEKKVIKKNSND